MIQKTIDSRSLLVPVWTALIVAFYAGTMVWCGVWTCAMCLPFFFCSLLSIQLIAFPIAALLYGARLSRSKTLPSVVAILVVVSLSIALSIAFDGVNGVLLLGNWSFVSVLSLPLAPVAFLFLQALEKRKKR